MEQDTKQLTGMAASPNVRLSDIARYCGVSLATVSRVLNHPEQHRADVVRQVRDAAEALGYDPDSHHTARRLSLQKHGKRLLNHQIGFFLPENFFESPYYRRLFKGVWDVLTPEGYGLLLARSDALLDSPLPPSFSRGEVDGVLLHTDPNCWQAMLDLLHSEQRFAQRPVLLLMHDVPGVPTVNVDQRLGAQKAAAHLLDLGHRHMLYTVKDRHTPHALGGRIAGYDQAYVDRGLHPEAYLHPIDMGLEYWEIANRPDLHHQLNALPAIPRPSDHPLLRSLQEYPDTTAILALNDQAAVLIHHVLTGAGIRVPQDISLIGFDDTEPLYDAEARNILTTVRVPLEEVGAAAARMMVDHVSGQRTDVKNLLFPTDLIIRSSTAPPRR
jgi:DNA-binding LacI/PurR family transcriptional regulator